MALELEAVPWGETSDSIVNWGARILKAGRRPTGESLCMPTRKRINSQNPDQLSDEPAHWMNLDELAEIEITSEHPEHPIGAALVPNLGRGWIAAEPGSQILRILFHQPQKLRCIQLKFMVERQDRTQEFVLRWSSATDHQKEILRQQYDFAGNAQEVEEYEVQLEGVKILELEITPSISGGEFFASLAEMRLR